MNSDKIGLRKNGKRDCKSRKNNRMEI